MLAGIEYPNIFQRLRVLRSVLFYLVVTPAILTLAAVFWPVGRVMLLWGQSDIALAREDIHYPKKERELAWGALIALGGLCASIPLAIAVHTALFAAALMCTTVYLTLTYIRFENGITKWASEMLGLSAALLAIAVFLVGLYFRDENKH